MVDKPQDESIKDKIIGLLDKGHSRSELIHDFGCKERTVDAAIKEHKKQHGHDRGEGKEAAASLARNDALALRKSGESVLPEWLETDVAQIFNGELQDQRIFLAGMSVSLMGLRLFAEGVKPIIDLMATWQEGQAQAARAAQGSGIEVAREAGEVAASGVAKFFLDTKPWLSASPDPLKAMVVDTMRPVFQQMFGQLMGTFLRGFGMPQAGSPGQPMPQNPPQGQTPLSTPGVEQIGKDEMEEVFGDE